MGILRVRAYGFLIAVVTGSLLPVWAVAGCLTCDPGGGAYNYCRAATGGYSRCYTGTVYCSLSGSRCAIARQGNERPPITLPLADDVQQDDATGIRLDMRPDRSQLQTPASDSAGIDEIRARVAEDAASGRLPDRAVSDSVLLIGSESRDDVWAGRAESHILRTLSTLKLGYLGLSRPAVRCTSTICEIAIVQAYDAAKDGTTSWQTQFSKLDDSGSWGGSFAESAMLMRMESGDRVAFFTYLHFDR